MFGLASSPRRTTPKYLSNVEVFIYMSTYVAFIAYGGWHLYQYGNVILRHAESSDFRTGWTWLFAGSRRPQENDDEWLHWTTYLIRYWPWFLGHAIAVEVSGFTIASATHRSYINAALGCAFFAHCNGLAITAAMVMYICVCHRLAVSPARRKWHIWLMAGLLMALLTAIKSETLMDLWLDPQTSTDNDWIWDLCVICAWTVCRMLSACLDTIDGISVAVEDVAKVDDDLETASKPPTTIDVIAYILYIPTLLFGPVLNFKHYQAMQQQRKRADFTPLHKRLVVFAGNCVRLVVLYGTIELLAHTFYVNALHVNAALVERMPVTALYAYGYAMGMRFYLKYVFVYGWSLALCRLQGMPSLPPLPRCIGRVHLYSDMWKWFDVGLYEFLFQYIYAALCRRDSTAARKLFASSATFVFIFLFHGMYDYVLVWSVLNYLCIVLEMLGRSVCTSEAATSTGSRCWPLVVGALSVPMQRRIVAVFGSQLQLLAILSNFFFFGGLQVGWIFVWRTYGAIGWFEYGGLSLCMLCIYHTSEWLKRKEEHGQRQRID